MAIKITPTGSHLVTSNGTLPLQGETSCSFSGWVRYDTPLVDIGINNFLISLGTTVATTFNLNVFNNDSGSWNVTCQWYNQSIYAFSADVSRSIPVIHVVGLYDQPNSRVRTYINGAISNTLTGVTSANPSQASDNMDINTDGATSGLQLSVDDFFFWNGHVLTPSEITGIYNGSINPSTIAATTRWRFTFEWPVGATLGQSVAPGDVGLVDTYGSGFSFSSSSPTHYTYADPIAPVYESVFNPAVTPSLSMIDPFSGGING